MEQNHFQLFVMHSRYIMIMSFENFVIECHLYVIRFDSSPQKPLNEQNFQNYSMKLFSNRVDPFHQEVTEF